MMTNDLAAIRRRDFLGFAMTALPLAMVGTVMPFRAHADPAGSSADSADATAPVQQLNAALLAAMRAGSNTPFSQRFAALAPVVEQTFDLDAVVATSVGLGWPAIQADQKAQLRTAFARYSVASYAANFDSYANQHFEIAPTVRTVGDGRVIVQTKLVAADGSATQLDYVMHHGPSGWKAVDVLAEGTISRVAAQRSEFSGLLRSGGAGALTSALQSKVASLSGGAVG
jgi:phospholipid transport system substrate-binding protein